jgi:acetyltransferase-like isoleucine patch superfamily enzyme
MSDQREVFIHSHALVESDQIGPGTRVWAFAHVLRGAVIGADCNICDHSYIDQDVVIGDRVTIKGQVAIVDGMTLEDDVFVGPNATFMNDRFPRSRHSGWQCERMVIGRGASIGSGATILPGVNIGEGAMVGAGAVVTRNVPPYTVVVGNPARVLREVTDEERIPERTRASNGAANALARS